MIDLSVDQLPAALRPREFKVGDRVRIRLSAECLGGRCITGSAFGHTDLMDQREGTVKVDHSQTDERIVRWAGIDLSHPYLVASDAFDVLGNGRPYELHAFYAAIELEPLGDES